MTRCNATPTKTQSDTSVYLPYPPVSGLNLIAGAGVMSPRWFNQRTVCEFCGYRFARYSVRPIQPWRRKLLSELSTLCITNRPIIHLLAFPRNRRPFQFHDHVDEPWPEPWPGSLGCHIRRRPARKRASDSVVRETATNVEGHTTRLEALQSCT